MVELEEYLKNPCGTLSIPYWKAQKSSPPNTMRIIHDSQFAPSYLDQYNDVLYFRLSHTLRSVANTVLDDSFMIRTAVPENDAVILTNLINACYNDVQVTAEQVFSWSIEPVFNKDLWLIVIERRRNLAVGAGIAEFDSTIGEGILEWVQVMPSYQRQDIGQFIVNQLLKKLQPIARFATVSGQMNNKTNPEDLYRKCGFVGNDIWHVLYEKRA